LVFALPLALGMASIIIAIFVSAILELVLEKFISGAGDIVSSAINLLMAVPVTKLATADIYRRLEWRSPRRTAPDLPGLQPAGEASASEGI
jgi:hypothetical protein